jgi:hypothetical protein
MTLYKRFLCAPVVLAVVALAFSLKPAFADTFKLLDLGIAESNSVVGIDTAGDVVIHGLDFCGMLGDCYKTYVNGVLSSISTTLPPLSYDNGTPCTPTVPPGYSPMGGVCNNGHFAFYNPFFETFPPGAYAGPNPIVLVHGPTVDGPIFLNASGDFAWTDGLNEENWEAVDLSVPEPSTFVLLATGAVAFAGGVRRRWCRANSI